MDKTETRKRSMELLERVGLDPAFAKRYPAQLSGGQQQRVGVARALAADPPVMLMDEPFSAVDPVVREQLQDEFLRLQGDLGKTIIFVTHDIDEAIKLGDQVAVLKVGGHLAQLAAPAYLLSHPVDDFVADFVGRDRGYRALSFQPTPRLPLASERTVAMGEQVERHRRRLGARGRRRQPPARLGRAGPDQGRGPQRDAAPRRHRRPGQRTAARRARRRTVEPEPARRDRRRHRRPGRARSRPTRC